MEGHEIGISTGGGGSDDDVVVVKIGIGILSVTLTSHHGFMIFWSFYMYLTAI